MRNQLEPLSTSDTECVAVLQWALPRLNLQMGRLPETLKRRAKQLGVEGLTAYRSVEQQHQCCSKQGHYLS